MIYGLHAIAVIVGVASAAATVAGGFVFGLPSLAAVVLNYVKRGEVAGGSWLEPLPLADPHLLVHAAVAGGVAFW